MPTTARDLIVLALKEAGILGVGQTPLSEDINDCFTLLKRMTAQWQKRRWMIPALTDIKKQANGAKSVTVGTGGFFDIPRPDKIQAAYFIQLGTGPTPVSFPLRQIFAYEDYARIAIKDLNSFPTSFFYDAAWPLANLFVYPIPSNLYEIHLIIKTDLGFPNDVNSVLLLPDEYEEAIHYNLALRICSMYKIQAQSATVSLAKVALNTIKNTNAQIPELIMPSALQSDMGFNIYNPDGY